MKSSFLVTLVLVLFCSAIFPQDEVTNTGKDRGIKLSGDHCIYVFAGLKMNSASGVSADVSGVKTESNLNVGIGYQYWFTEQWSVCASLGVFSAGSNVDLPRISSISIIPVLFGFNYYPKILSLGEAGRVHFGINAGAYVANSTRTDLGLFNAGSSAVNESVFGIEPNAGIDFFAGSWLNIGPSVSYHLINEFNEVTGIKRDLSGPIFSLHIGLLL